MQLNHHHHTFAVVHRIDQRVHQFGVFGYAVNVDFDTDDFRIKRGLAHKLRHVLKAVIRVVQ
ncbi:Uncharacterised protein [Vibrio cholerae]|nr:Uncharacterised protein [Vibrio cholerae]CSC51239.1 Uncharacterised protein [Vibrio cholerae]CSI52956.1 Uncharacterised protein [Vibrio cholerae]